MCTHIEWTDIWLDLRSVETAQELEIVRYNPEPPIDPTSSSEDVLK